VAEKRRITVDPWRWVEYDPPRPTDNGSEALVRAVYYLDFDALVEGRVPNAKPITQDEIDNCIAREAYYDDLASGAGPYWLDEGMTEEEYEQELYMRCTDELVNPVAILEGGGELLVGYLLDDIRKELGGERCRTERDYECLKTRINGHDVMIVDVEPGYDYDMPTVFYEYAVRSHTATPEEMERIVKTIAEALAKHVGKYWPRDVKY